MNKKTVAVGVGLSLAASGAWAIDWFNLPLIGGNDKVSVTTTTGSGGNTDVSAARVRVLNKDSNRLSDVTLAAGQHVSGGQLQFSMKRCVRDIGGVPGQDAAWLDIRDNTNASLFEGWMFNLYPDVAAVENSRYDVRLLGCLRASLPTPPPVRKAPVDTGSSYVPTRDAEAPQDEGDDPNYVPGVGSPQPEAQRAPEEFPSASASSDGRAVVGPPTGEPAAAEAPAGGQDELHDLMDSY